MAMRYSLFSLLEFVTVLCVALAGCQLANLNVHLFGAPIPLAYVVFYFFKVVISKLDRIGKPWAILLYALLATVFATFSLWWSSELPAFEIWSITLMMSMFTSLWLVVPTITFFSDIRNKRTARLLMWRSVLELVILCPVGTVVAGFIWVFILMGLGGLWT